jgi:hypothetical protein
LHVTTFAQWDNIDDFINGVQPKVWEGFTYEGPVVELKKGRNQLASASNAGVANTTQAQGIANRRIVGLNRNLFSVVEIKRSLTIRPEPATVNVLARPGALRFKAPGRATLITEGRF